MPRATAKIFRNGRGQAVRLPKGFRFAGDEVYIEKRGDSLVLSPKEPSWADFFAQAPLPSEDLPRTRDDLPPQRRDGLLSRKLGRLSVSLPYSALLPGPSGNTRHGGAPCRVRGGLCPQTLFAENSGRRAFD